MIVFCHLLNDRSGSPRVLASATEALAPTGGDNLLYIGSQGRGILEQAPALKRRYWYRRSRFRVFTLFALLASQIDLIRKLSSARDIPTDAIVYVNTLLPFGAAIWASVTGRPVVWHVHEVSLSPAPLRWFLTRIAARTADLLIYVSEDHRRRLPIGRQRSVVLSNPLAPELQEQGRKTGYLPRRSGAFDVLMLASPRDFKGVPEFLLLARAMSWRPDVRFTLVLNGDEPEIATYLDRSRLPVNVRVHARTNNPARFYASADLVVNLSRVDLWVETFGLTLIEAMAFGIPVIAPPVGGPTEIVAEGVDGFLIDSRDLSTLSEAVTRLVEDPALCLAMSAAARRKAEIFSQQAFATQLKRHVETLRQERMGA